MRAFLCVVAASTWVGCGGGGGGVNYEPSTGQTAGGNVGDSGLTGVTSGGNGGGSTNAGGGTGDGGMGTTPGVAVGTGICPSYQATSIAAMRMPPTAGCYELTHVGLVARTDSPTEPRVYLQDEGGTDYSAILAKCSATGMHSCSAEVASLIPQLHDTFTEGAALTVRGYYQYTQTDGFEQFYIEQIIDEGTTIARPDPIKLAIADLTIDARTTAKWYQRASIVIAAQDPLTMYDFSPDDLALTGSTACPAFGGFAMIPKSAGVAAATGCTGTTSPAARALDPREILVGRQFFKQFLFSSDCACAAGTGQIVVKPGQTVSGTVVGYLTLAKDKGTVAPYQVFQAAADQTFNFK